MIAPAAGFRARDLGAALVWGGGFSIFASQLATLPAVLFALVAAAVGYYAGGALARTRLKTVVGLLGLPLLGRLLLVPAGIFAGSPLAARALGAEGAFIATDLLTWSIIAFFSVTTFHFLSTRYPAWVSLEVAVVALFLASPFAAHRDGYINRPHFLVDPLWSRGWDPIPMLFFLGALSAAVLIVLTVGRSTRRASPLDVALLLGLVGVLFLLLPEGRLRDWIPEPKGSMGLQGDPEGGQPPPEGGTPREHGEGDHPQNPGEMPMEDHTKPQAGRPVAVVILRDDYDPPYGFFYFRQTAFSQYNGRRLVADTTGLANNDLAVAFPVRKVRLDVPPHDQSAYRTLETRVAMIASHTSPFGLVDPASVKPAPNPNPDQFWRAYDVESLVLTEDFSSLLGRRAGSDRWDQRLWDHYTEIPDDPRYRELAESLLEELAPEYRDDPVARAVAIKLYLEQEGTYSLNSDHMNASDPVASFLFGDKTGYCVHFAHAACYLYRSLGLPSRVAGGYGSDARDRGAGSAILLREGDAHAWPEVYFEGLGWVVFDIFPAKSLVEPLEQPDPDLQRMLGEMARDESEPGTREEQTSLRELLLAWLKALGAVLGVLALVGMVALYAIKVVRRLAPGYGPDELKVRACYRAALDCLCDAGLLRAWGQGRLRFAEELKARYPSLEPLTLDHLRVTLGPPGSRASAENALHEYVQLRSQIRAHVPLWRRFVGLLDPSTYLRVK